VSSVALILSAIEQGDSPAAGQLLPPVYEELRKLAAAKLANETPAIRFAGICREAYIPSRSRRLLQMTGWEERSFDMAIIAFNGGRINLNKHTYLPRDFEACWLQPPSS
jgi:hypothetical protein